MEKYGSSTDLCAGCKMRVLMARPRGSAAPLLLASSSPAACSSSFRTRAHVGEQGQGSNRQS